MIDDKAKVISFLYAFINNTRPLKVLIEKPILRICFPIISKFKDLADECGYDFGEYVDYPNEFVSYSGSLTSIVGYDNFSITFRYVDNGRRNERVRYQTLVRMPLDWLNLEAPEKYRELWYKEKPKLPDRYFFDIEKNEYYKNLKPTEAAYWSDNYYYYHEAEFNKIVMDPGVKFSDILNLYFSRALKWIGISKNLDLTGTLGNKTPSQNGCTGEIFSIAAASKLLLSHGIKTTRFKSVSALETVWKTIDPIFTFFIDLDKMCIDFKFSCVVRGSEGYMDELLDIAEEIKLEVMEYKKSMAPLSTKIFI